MRYLFPSPARREYLWAGDRRAHASSARVRVESLAGRPPGAEAWLHGRARCGARAQAANCTAGILPMAAQPLALAAGATCGVTFEVFLASSAGAASMGCDVGVLDSQARANTAAVAGVCSRVHMRVLDSI